jgi:hypothetical protein
MPLYCAAEHLKRPCINGAGMMLAHDTTVSIFQSCEREHGLFAAYLR